MHPDPHGAFTLVVPELLLVARTNVNELSVWMLNIPSIGDNLLLPTIL